MQSLYLSRHSVGVFILKANSSFVYIPSALQYVRLVLRVTLKWIHSVCLPPVGMLPYMLHHLAA